MIDVIKTFEHEEDSDRDYDVVLVKVCDDETGKSENRMIYMSDSGLLIERVGFTEGPVSVNNSNFIGHRLMKLNRDKQLEMSEFMELLNSDKEE